MSDESTTDETSAEEANSEETSTDEANSDETSTDTPVDGTDGKSTADVEESAEELSDEEALGTEPARASPGDGEVFCRDCGAVISENAEICPACGVRQQEPPKSSVESVLDDLTEGGNPFIAAGLSVVLPGLGQLYNRELEKGIIVMVASLVALASVVVLVGVVLYPAIWLYAIYDAYVVA